MKRIIDLENDEEVNEAHRVAARGAVIGAATVSRSPRVCYHTTLLGHTTILLDSACYVQIPTNRYGQWGAYGFILGVGAHCYSPVFRNLTIQFKV
jgi:hypothetical protein